MENETEQNVIYGRNAVTEALLSEQEIDVVYLQRGTGQGKILSLAKSRGVVVKELSDERLAALAGTQTSTEKAKTRSAVISTVCKRKRSSTVRK